MSIASEITRINTNIANSYTAVDNKNGTLPQVQNSANLASAINSIEVIEQAPAEGESLSLTNTKAMPYSDYVVKGKSEQEGTPSPSIPSEIHSVADDVNLFDKEASVLRSANCTYTYENGVYTITNTNSYNPVLILSNILPKGSYVLNSDNYLSVATQIRNSNGDTLANCGPNYQNKTFEISSDADRIYFNWATTSNPIILNLNSLKIQKGLTATPYSPYNQGTVTIKQRGTTENNDYTIQTEPLRSLPNGVKDTIEADGIHRKVGRVVLDDVITLYEATLFGTQGKFASYQLQNAKNENRNYNFISDKIAYANEQFVKYGAYRNQAGLIVLTTIDDTLENFNSKISGSKVLYELAEEVIEPLTQNQATTMLDIIKTGSYEGTTNIYTDEDVKPTMKVGYYKKG